MRDLASANTDAALRLSAALDRDPVLVICSGPGSALVPPGAHAWTLGRLILMREAAWDPAARSTHLLIAHECVHVTQWHDEGRMRFPARYLLAYLGRRLSGLGHDAAYRAIPAEQDAYAVQDELARVPGSW